MENSSHLPQEQCPLTLDGAVEYEMKHGRLFNDPNIDLKKIRRIISNRLSAQRCRNKMVNHTCGLEKMVKDLEELLISILTPQVESNKEKKRLLQLENDILRQQLEKRSSESRLLEIAIEEKRAVIIMLKEVDKTAQKNKHGADSEATETPDLRLGPHKVAPYPSVNFYQTSLQNQQGNSSPAVAVESAPDPATQQSGKGIEPAKEVAECNKEYEDVDQYINFDALNAACGAFSGEN